MIIPVLIPLLSIANCGHPEVLFTARNEFVPKVVRTEDFIPVEGSTVTFSCPPGFELIGSDTATCTENGIWEPDPSRLICNNSTSEESMSRIMHKILQIEVDHACINFSAMHAVMHSPCIYIY